METINNIELRDDSTYPDEKVLKEILGKSHNAYRQLLNLFDNNEMKCTWRYYHDGKAWLCKVQKKSRTVVWMSAWRGHMQATIYFPERLIKEVFGLGISKEQVEKIKKTKNVGQSKPVIFEIRNKGVLKDLEKVMQFKMITK